MGGDLEALKAWRREISSGALMGPRIVAAGPMLLPPRRSASPATSDPAELRVGTPNEARAAVDRLRERGADFVKIIEVPRESYFAIAEESKKVGISFVGHVPSEVNAIEASNAGQKSIEHVLYSSLAFDCSSEEAQLRRKVSEAAQKRDEQAVADATDEANRSYSRDKATALWRTFRMNGTWVTPTLFSSYANAHHLEDAPTDPELAFLPEALRKEWAPSQNPTQDNRDTAAWWQRQFENDRKLTGEMHQAGVRLLAGSDSLDRYVFVGTSLHRELQMLVTAGLTPFESLQTATRNVADFLGQYDLGTIAVGKHADLLLLDADPTLDIANTQKISAVILRGNLLSRAELNEMLSKARTAAATFTADRRN
jgi:hypothetical protein